jgi:hypothetical protein
LIVVFKEAFRLARSQNQESPQSLDATGVQLDSAYLAGANLKQAWMPEASLPEANLSKAKLSETNLNGARLVGANLSGAKGLTKEQLAGNPAKTPVTPACSIRCNKTSYLRRVTRPLGPKKLRGQGDLFANIPAHCCCQGLGGV